MSIVPSPGQMGPGTGLIRLGTGLMKHPTLFKGLGMGPALMGLGVGITIADLQRTQKHGLGWDVQAFRDKKADQLMTHILIPVILRILPSSAGGGGPGEIPNLHRPPPSIEETGEILSNPGSLVEVPSSPRRSTSKKAGKRPKCPPGYYWHKGRKKCVPKAQKQYENLWRFKRGNV